MAIKAISKTANTVREDGGVIRPKKNEEEQPKAAPSVPAVDEETARLWGLKPDQVYAPAPAAPIEPIKPQTVSKGSSPAREQITALENTAANMANAGTPKAVPGIGYAAKQNGAFEAVTPVQKARAAADTLKEFSNTANKEAGELYEKWLVSGSDEDYAAWSKAEDEGSALADRAREAESRWKTARSEARLTAKEKERISAEYGDLLAKAFSDEGITKEEQKRLLELQYKLADDSENWLETAVHTADAAGYRWAGGFLDLLALTGDMSKVFNAIGKGRGDETVQAAYNAWKEIGDATDDYYFNYLENSYHWTGDHTAEEFERLQAETGRAYNEMVNAMEAYLRGRGELNGTVLGFEAKGLANKLNEQAEAWLSAAKQNKSAFGQIVVDAAESGVEMALDAGTAKILGSLPLKPTVKEKLSLAVMALRVMGGGSREAEETGGNVLQRGATGFERAFVEVLSENLEGIGGLYGKGALDDVVERFLEALDDETAVFLFRTAAAGGGEALEEVVSAILSPIVESNYDPEALDKYSTKEGRAEIAKDALYSAACAFLTSGVIGAGGQVVGNMQTRAQTKAQARAVVDAWAQTEEGKQYLEQAKAAGVDTEELLSMLRRGAEETLSGGGAADEARLNEEAQGAMKGRPAGAELRDEMMRERPEAAAAEENPEAAVTEEVIREAEGIPPEAPAAPAAEQGRPGESLKERLMNTKPEAERSAEEPAGEQVSNKEAERRLAADPELRAKVDRVLSGHTATASQTRNIVKRILAGESLESIRSDLREKLAVKPETPEAAAEKAESGELEFNDALDAAAEGLAEKNAPANTGMTEEESRRQQDEAVKQADREARREELEAKKAAKRAEQEQRLTATETDVADTLTNAEHMSEEELTAKLNNDNWREAFSRRMGIELNGSPRQQLQTIRNAAQDYVQNGGFMDLDTAEELRRSQNPEAVAAEQRAAGLEQKLEEQKRKAAEDKAKAVESERRQAAADVKEVSRQYEVEIREHNRYEKSIEDDLARADAKVEKLGAQLERGKVKKLSDKVRGYIRDFKNSLFNGGEKTHIPIELRDTMANVVEYLAGAELADAGTVTEDIRRSVEERREKIIAELDRRQAQLDELAKKNPDDTVRVGKNTMTVRARMEKIVSGMNETVRGYTEFVEAAEKKAEAKRNTAQTRFEDIVAKLRAQRELDIKLRDSEKNNTEARQTASERAAALSEDVLAALDGIAESLEGKTLSELDSREMEEVLGGLKMIDKAIQDARKIKARGRSHDAMQFYDRLLNMLRSHKGLNENSGSLLVRGLRSVSSRISLGTMRPAEYFQELDGGRADGPFRDLYENLRTATKTVMTHAQTVGGFFEDIVADKSIIKERSDIIELNSLRGEDGKPVKINRGAMLSLYMILQNEGAKHHAVYGGTVFANAEDYNHGINDHGWGSSSQKSFTELENIENDSEVTEARRSVDERKEQLKGLGEDADPDVKDAVKAELDEAKERLKAAREAAAERNAAQAEAKAAEIMAEIEGSLNDNDRRVLEAARKLFDYYNLEIQKANESVYGYAKPMVDNYFPIAVAQAFGVAQNPTYAAMLEDIDVSNWNAMKSRKDGAAQPIRVMDIYDVLAGYSRKAAAYCGMLEATHDIRKLMGIRDYRRDGNANTSLQNELTDHYGKKGWEYLDKLIADLNGGQAVGSDVLDGISGNMAAAVLNMNPVVAITQHASLWTAVNKVKLGNLMKANHPLGAKTKAELTARINKYSPYLYDRTRIGNGILSNYKSMSDHLSVDAKGVFNWISNMDKLTVEQLWLACEYQVEQDGDFTEHDDAFYEETAKLWEACLESTQPMYDALFRSDWQRNNEAKFLKTMLRFTTVPMQNWNHMRNGYRSLVAAAEDYKANPSDSNKARLGEARHELTARVGGVVLSNAVYAFTKTLIKIATGKGDKYKDEDEEYTLRSIAEGMAWTFAEAIGGTVPLAGSVAVAGLEAIITGSTNAFSTNFSVPAFDVIDDISSALTNVVKGILSEDTKGTGKALQGLHALLLTADAMNGGSVRNIEGIIEGIVDWGITIKQAVDGDSRHELGDARFKFNTLLGNAGKGLDAEAVYDSMFVQRSSGRLADMYLDAYRSGDSGTMDYAAGLMGERDRSTVGADSTESLVRSAIRKSYMDGKEPMERDDAIEMLHAATGLDMDEAEALVKEWDFKKEHGTNYADLKETYIKVGELGDGTYITTAVLAKAFAEVDGMDKSDALDKAQWWAYLKAHRDDAVLGNITLKDWKALRDGTLTEREMLTYKAIDAVMDKTDLTKTTDEFDAIDALVRQYSRADEAVADYINSGLMHDLSVASVNGIKSEEFYKWYNEFKRLDGDKNLTANQKTMEFKYLLDSDKSLTKQQREVLAANLKFYGTLTGKSEKYDYLTEGRRGIEGIPIEDAKRFVDAYTAAGSPAKQADIAQLIMDNVPPEYWEAVWLMVRPSDSKASWAKVMRKAGA